MMPGKMKEVVQPSAPDPVRVPSPDDPDVIAAKQKRMQEEFAKRRGRASTDLAQPSAAPAYSRTTLG